jgi:hypothetical protein
VHREGSSSVWGGGVRPKRGIGGPENVERSLKKSNMSLGNDTQEIGGW